jgi:hypothetical protein
LHVTGHPRRMPVVPSLATVLRYAFLALTLLPAPAA